MLVAEDTMKATARSCISTPCFSHFTLNETKTQKNQHHDPARLQTSDWDYKLITKVFSKVTDPVSGGLVLP